MAGGDTHVVRLGEVVPDMEFDSTEGKMKLYEYLGDSWGVLFSHPADFTPVCTTELGKIAKLKPEFDKRGAKLLGLSCDSVGSHKEWIKDIEAYQPDAPVLYPIAADEDRRMAAQLNMLDYSDVGAPQAPPPSPPTAAAAQAKEQGRKDQRGPLASRALHIIGPDKKLKLSYIFPGTVGRNFEEVLRSLDALQLVSARKVATPANWKKGERVIVSPSLTEEEARKQFPDHEVMTLPSGKPYLRLATVQQEE